jgi:hypothetical protein
MAWYIVGPDKTGLKCDNCCAAFVESFGSCTIKSCSVSGSSVFRNFVCPSTAFPTPLHYYKITPSTGNVTIEPNPRLCSTVGTDCYTYTPTTGLNTGGRIGSGCSQTYVTSTRTCNGSQAPCALTCDTACGYVVSGFQNYPKSCVPNPSGVCSCVSQDSFDDCRCECVDGPFAGACFQTYDSEGSCFVSGISPDCILCPDGTYACGEGAECCGGAAYPSEPCAECQDYSCSDTGYICAERICFPSCSRSGYSCICGSCQCNTSYTCCTDDAMGWSFDSSERICKSCGYGYSGSSSGCCDTDWKRKGCDAGSVCCNDGRCYAESTTLCVII